MTFIYRYKKRDKPEFIPDAPEEFFNALGGTPDWALRQEGIKKSEVLRARTVFQDATNALNGEVPLLWIFA